MVEVDRNVTATEVHVNFWKAGGVVGFENQPCDGDLCVV